MSDQKPPRKLHVFSLSSGNAEFEFDPPTPEEAAEMLEWLDLIQRQIKMYLVPPSPPPKSE